MMRDKNWDSGPSDEVPCSTHPDAPHGFNRNASHTEDRYVCDCEGWKPPAGARDAVTDDMVERACAAFYSDLAWRTNSSQSRDFMRSALEAALAGKAEGGEFLPQLPCAYCPPPGVNESERCDDCQFGKATQPAAPGAGEDQSFKAAGAASAQQPLHDSANITGVATGSRNESASEGVTRGNLPPLSTNTAAPGMGDATSLRELAEVLDVPEGYEVAEFLPGLWHYKYDDDGLLMASGTTWNHPALAATAAWKAALAAHPSTAGGEVSDA